MRRPIRAWKPHKRRRRAEFAYNPRDFYRRNAPQEKIIFNEINSPKFLRSLESRFGVKYDPRSRSLDSPVESPPLEAIHKGRDWDWRIRPIKDASRHIVAQKSGKDKKHLLLLPGSSARDTDVLRHYGVANDDSTWTLIERDLEEYGYLRGRAAKHGLLNPQQSVEVESKRPPSHKGDKKTFYYNESLESIRFRDPSGQMRIRGTENFDFVWLDLLGNLNPELIRFLAKEVLVKNSSDVFFTFTSTHHRGPRESFFTVLKRTLWEMGDYPDRNSRSKELRSILEQIERGDVSSSRSGIHTRSPQEDATVAVHYALLRYIFPRFDFDCESWVYNDHDKAWMVIYHLKNFRKIVGVNPYYILINKIGASTDLLLAYRHLVNSNSLTLKELSRLTTIRISSAWGISKEEVSEFIKRWLAINRLKDPLVYIEYTILEAFEQFLVSKVQSPLVSDNPEDQIADIVTQLKEFNPQALDRNIFQPPAVEEIRPYMEVIPGKNPMIVITTHPDELDPYKIPLEYRISVDTAEDPESEDAGLKYLPATLPGEGKPGELEGWPVDETGRPVPAVSILQLTPVFLSEINRLALFSLFRNLFRGDRYLHPQLCSMANYKMLVRVGGKDELKTCFRLSDPQKRALTHFKYDLHRGSHTGLVNLPTGMGKTIVAIEAIKHFLTTETFSDRILFITNNKLILDGAIRKFKEHTGYENENDYCRFYDKKTLPPAECLSRPFVFASVQSLTSKYGDLRYQLNALRSKQDDPSKRFTKRDEENLRDLQWQVFKYLNHIEWGHFGLVIVDEAHHAPSATWMEVVSHLTNPMSLTRDPARRPTPGSAWKRPYLLGLTATPFRGDATPVDEMFDENYLVRMPLNRGIWEGYLAWPYYRIFNDGILDNVQVQQAIMRGEDVEDEEGLDLTNLQARKQISPGYQRLVLKAYLSAAKGKKGIVFCTRTEGADAMAHYFSNVGARGFDDGTPDLEAQQLDPVPSISIHSQLTAQQLRDLGIRIRGKPYPPGDLGLRKLKEDVPKIFSKGIDLIFAVTIFDEGVDMPEIEVLLKLNKTVSPVKNIQQLGRGLRLFPYKRDVLVLDFTGNIHTLHSLYNLQQYVTYTPGDGRGSGEDEPPDPLTAIPFGNFAISAAARLAIQNIVRQNEQRVNLSDEEKAEIIRLRTESYSIYNILEIVNAKRNERIKEANRILEERSRIPKEGLLKDLADEQALTNEKGEVSREDLLRTLSKLPTIKLETIESLCAGVIPAFSDELIHELNVILFFIDDQRIGVNEIQRKIEDGKITYEQAEAEYKALLINIQNSMPPREKETPEELAERRRITLDRYLSLADQGAQTARHLLEGEILYEKVVREPKSKEEILEMLGHGVEVEDLDMLLAGSSVFLPWEEVD